MRVSRGWVAEVAGAHGSSREPVALRVKLIDLRLAESWSTRAAGAGGSAVGELPQFHPSPGGEGAQTALSLGGLSPWPAPGCPRGTPAISMRWRSEPPLAGRC